MPKLPTNRDLGKFILLSLITFGIYAIVVMSEVSTSINTIAEKYDGKHTMHYCLIFFVFGPLTFGVMSFIWSHQFSARIGKELKRRGIEYSFGPLYFWLFNVLGAIYLFGPFVYAYKLLRSMNLLCDDYNRSGC